ncbi:MAG: TolC family protein [Bacteroidetes bacterium]|nr:TolC family protein [Bacteroidota bacterium]
MRIVTLLILAFLLNAVQAQERNLDFYFDKAKVFSPLINQAQNANKIVGLDMEQIKSILSKPEINVDASVLFAPIISHDNNSNRLELVSNGANSYTGYDMAVTDGGQYQSMVSLRQPLFTGSSFRAYSGKTDILRQVNENRISLTSHELQQIISHQYLLCIRAKRTAETNRQLLAELSGQVKLMQKLVENAIYKQSDLMQLKIEYDNFKLNDERARSDFRSNLYDLNLLCGIKDTSTVDLREIDPQIKIKPAYTSGFLNSYRLDSLNISAEQNISGLKYKPQINFFANAGMNAVYLPTLNRLGLSAGLTLKWNIFDGQQRKLSRQKTAINLQTLNFEKQHFITQQEINKNALLNQIASLDKRKTMANSQLEQYEQLLKVYRAQLAQGEISVIDFKTMLRDLAYKRQECALLDLEKQALIISYNYWNY